MFAWLRKLAELPKRVELLERKLSGRDERLDILSLTWNRQFAELSKANDKYCQAIQEWSAKQITATNEFAKSLDKQLTAQASVLAGCNGALVDQGKRLAALESAVKLLAAPAKPKSKLPACKKKRGR